MHRAVASVVAVVAVLAVLAVGGVGCGGDTGAAPTDDPVDGPAPTAEAQAAPATEGDPPTSAPAVPAPETTTTTTTAPTTTIAPTSTTALVPLASDPDARPVPAGDPAGLAAQIVEAESAIHDPAVSPQALAAAGHLQQVAYRQLADNPTWDPEVLALIGPDLGPGAVANVGAQRELRALGPATSATLPAWTIVDPDPADALRLLYLAGEDEFGVPWQYLAAVHLTETRMGRIRGVSSAGAMGPMQFIPSTWAAYGEGDINDNRDAVRAAARYLNANGGDCRPRAPCDLANALFRYNPTPRYVNAVTAYAERMRADEAAFRAYHGWQVYYRTVIGDVWLPVGFSADAQRPATPADLDLRPAGG